MYLTLDNTLIPDHGKYATYTCMYAGDEIFVHIFMCVRTVNQL